MFRGTFKRMVRSRIAVPGLILVGFVVAFAVFVPLVSPYPPDKMYTKERLSPPSRQFLMGTDNFGRDLLTRVAFGARISIRVALISVSVAMVGGTAIGVLAGAYGDTTDSLLMQLMEVLLALPSLLLALVIMGVLGSNLPNLILAISLVSVPTFARLVRGEVLSLKGRAFVEAAQSIGATRLSIIWRHLLPNVVPVLLIQTSLQLSAAILTEASLSYLGYGTQPPAASWGRMLSEGRAYFGSAPWMALWPGLFVMIALIGFNLLGDGLRDCLDPWLRGR